MPKNVIITNLKKLEKIKQKIAKDGADKLHILADFDRTLTKNFDIVITKDSEMTFVNKLLKEMIIY